MATVPIQIFLIQIFPIQTLPVCRTLRICDQSTYCMPDDMASQHPDARHHLLFFRVFLLAILTMLGITAKEATSQSRPGFLNDDVAWHWPTNASRYMSSSFGETRAAHFHAAMDIGTWGHEGYAVFAARDGIVHRIGIGPFGYGNVIYLRHDDGSISLYAHLKDFHPRIRSIVDSLRLRNYSFDFNRYMEQYNIRFQRGQQIGWTGSTGAGPPHLHFELRTPQGRPFNPFLAGIHIEDTIPPQFSGLAVEPLAANSIVDGSSLIHRRRPSRRGGSYHFGAITVQGEIGLAVNVFDRANASNNVHSVYELEMFVNDERYFHSRADSFSYNQSRQMFIDRVYPILQNERRGYQRLYIRNANTLPFYLDTGHSGRLDLPSGEHHIRIVASDFWGNRSQAYLSLQVTEPEESAISKTITFPEGYIDWRLRQPETPDHPPATLVWHKNWVRPGPETPDSESGRISIRPLGSFLEEMQTYHSDQEGLPLNLAERVKLRKGDSSWILHRIRPEHPVSVYHDGMRIALHFPVRSFFEPVSIGIAGTCSDFTLFPDIEPFQRPVTVHVLLDEEVKSRPGIGLYRVHPRNGNLSHVSSNVDHKRKMIVGTISSSGRYIIESDTLAPEISGPAIGKWRHTDRYYATVRVDDDLSGLDYRSAEFFVNGIRGIAEFDPEKGLLRYHHPDFTPQPLNEITVRVSDRAGNTAETTFSGVRYN